VNKSHGIIFDLDDTLYAESDYVESGFQCVAKWAAQKWEMNPQGVLDDLNQLHNSDQRGRVFNAWLSRHELDESLVSEFVAVYREHKPTIRPFELVSETILTLRKSYRIGLISDGYLVAQQNKFQAIEMDDHFDSVLFSDSLGREHWKPHRLPFDTMRDALGIDADNAIYVGDNPKKDFIGARRAGMRSIRIRHDGGIYSRLEAETDEHRPDVEIAKWADLVGAISRIWNS